MRTTIYYFSATGNSMTTARILARNLGDCKLAPVASVKNLPKIVEEAPAVGFVFPVYYGNMPYPVREAISKMVFQKDAYIFLFPTFRGHAGDVAKRADQLLKTRGQKLSLCLGIPMPGNSFLNEPKVDAGYLERQEENIRDLMKAIRNREERDYAESGVLPLTPVGFPNNFRGILAEEGCIGCGTCVQVCPMDNIRLENGKAAIGDNCATCLACFHWCPQEAVCMSRQEGVERRKKYRHPDVSLGEIIAQKGTEKE